MWLAIKENIVRENILRENIECALISYDVWWWWCVQKLLGANSIDWHAGADWHTEAALLLHSAQSGFARRQHASTPIEFV